MTRRFLPIVLMLVALPGTIGCVRNIRVTPVLPVARGATLDVQALVGRVNGLVAEQRTLNAPVWLTFRDLREQEQGRNKQYPAADARLLLERPNNIRLQIKVPVVGRRVADMSSNGETFRVAVFYPENKKKFILGSNAGKYKRIEADSETRDPELQQAGALANIRPQHLTEAFLIQPIALEGSETIYFLDEVRQTERDTRPRAKRNAEVVRSYYVLTMLERIGGGAQARIVRRIWFDRTVEGTELARQDLYEEGHLATIVTYREYFKTASGLSWPKLVRIERVGDGYAAEALFRPDDFRINVDVPHEAFELQNTESLPAVDLDRLPNVREPGIGAD